MAEDQDGIWGTITHKDMIISAYVGYLANDRSNGYDIKAGSNRYQNNSHSSSKYQYSLGLQTPGAFGIPICSYKLASFNFDMGVRTSGSTYEKYNTYPCSHFGVASTCGS